eukprot:SAG31_NODE_403_length_16150_cov_12.566588_3_plen_73_part_00
MLAPQILKTLAMTLRNIKTSRSFSRLHAVSPQQKHTIKAYDCEMPSDLLTSRGELHEPASSVNVNLLCAQAQ